MVEKSPCGIVGVDDLPAEFETAKTTPVIVANGSTDLKSVEQVVIAAALHACGGDYTNGAKRLGVARLTLYSRVTGFNTAVGTRERYSSKL